MMWFWGVSLESLGKKLKSWSCGYASPLCGMIQHAFPVSFVQFEASFKTCHSSTNATLLLEVRVVRTTSLALDRQALLTKRMGKSSYNFTAFDQCNHKIDQLKEHTARPLRIRRSSDLFFHAVPLISRFCVSTLKLDFELLQWFRYAWLCANMYGDKYRIAKRHTVPIVRSLNHSSLKHCNQNRFFPD